MISGMLPASKMCHCYVSQTAGSKFGDHYRGISRPSRKHCSSLITREPLRADERKAVESIQLRERCRIPRPPEFIAEFHSGMSLGHTASFHPSHQTYLPTFALHTHITSQIQDLLKSPVLYSVAPDVRRNRPHRPSSLCPSARIPSYRCPPLQSRRATKQHITPKVVE